MKFILRAAIAGYFLLLILLIIGSTGWVAVNWPFELFLSYIRHVIVAFPILALLGWINWKKSLAPLCVLAVFAFFPFFTFSKYTPPSKSVCAQGECLTVISTNLRGRPDAFDALAQSDTIKTADVIGLYELPYKLNKVQLAEAFPDYNHIELMRVSPKDNAPLGSFIALLSRYPISDTPLRGVSYRHERWADRGFISYTVQLPNQSEVLVTAIHPRLPMSYASTARRNDTLGRINEHVSKYNCFIIMGDFNLTPWTPEFRKLPGKRAGDPRFISTWDAQRFWTGIPIDHIMVSENIEVVEASVLDSVGSDHFPIMAVIKIAD